MPPPDREDYCIRAGALWRHRGGNGPHALLTSGLHSDGYLNVSKLIQSPTAVEQLASGLKTAIARMETPTWVVGSPFGSITLAYELARQLVCSAGFVERDENGVPAFKRFKLEPGAKVLMVDDVFTTGGTTLGAIAAVSHAGGDVLDYVCVIANRSGRPCLGERLIVSLMRPEFNTWEPAACPLCQQGSEILRPKSNWARLMRP